MPLEHAPHVYFNSSDPILAAGTLYNESVNIGCEYGFRERVFLRAGYKSLFMEESVEGLTVGVGLIYFLTDYLPMKVDYAYADFGRLQSVHRISVEIGF